MAKQTPTPARYRVLRGTNIRRSLTLTLPPAEAELRFEPGDVVAHGDYPAHTNVAWLVESGAWEVIDDG